MGGSSRLEKLLRLLECGTSDATRKAAAKQIVDITKSHPQQLPSVIRKVQQYLYSKAWDARVAASETLGLLAEVFPHPSISDLTARCAQLHGDAASSAAAQSPTMTFSTFSLQVLLDKGTALLACGGQEYDVADEPGLTVKQRLEKQRALLKKRLGLESGVEGGPMDTDDLINDEDLDAHIVRTPAAKGAAAATPVVAPKQQPAELLQSMEGLSARERNQAKRKAKAMARAESSGARGLTGVKAARGGAKAGAGTLASADASGGNAVAGASGPATGAAGTGGAGVRMRAASAELAAEAAEADEAEWACAVAGAWPFQGLCDQLCVDVLDATWEVRHGAATALREVLRTHASSAAIEAPMADEVSGWVLPGGTGMRNLGDVTCEALSAAVAANARWLEECVMLLLCVLSLDRFADYGADQVTAPVRETAAQTLGVTLGPLTPPSVNAILQLLTQLQNQTEWDVRYGGYLGLKYMLAARLDLAVQLLPAALPFLQQGLEDPDDDVRAASADALVPVAAELLALGPATAHTICTLLWALLAELDELSPAIASVVQLLSHLYAQPPAAGAGGGTLEAGCATGGGAATSKDLTHQLPRLWPYLRHGLSGVRLSTTTCMERLLAASLRQGCSEWLHPLLPMMLRLVFQQLLVEHDSRVQAAAMRVWGLLLDCSPPEVVAAVLQRPALEACKNHTGQQPRVGAPASGPPAAAAAAAAAGVDSAVTAAAAAGATTPPSVAGAPPAAAAGAAAAAGGGAASVIDGRTSVLRCMLLLAATPPGHELDVKGMVVVQEPSAAHAAKAAPTAGAGSAAGAPPPAKRARKTGPGAPRGGLAGKPQGTSRPTPAQQQHVGSAYRPIMHVVGSAGEGSAIAMRVRAAEALGKLCKHVDGKDAGLAQAEAAAALALPSATMRSLAALVVSQWVMGACEGHASGAAAPAAPAAAPVSPQVQQQLQQTLVTTPSQPFYPASSQPYSETGTYYSQMRREVLALINACMQAGWLLHTPGELPVDQLNAEHVLQMLTTVPEAAQVDVPKARLHDIATSLLMYEQYLHLTSLACCAAAVVHCGPLPLKLNHIIQPLMAAVRKEPEPDIQEVCARALAELIATCASRAPSPNEKLVRNVCSMACGDPAHTPVVTVADLAGLHDADLTDAQLQDRLHSHASAGAASSTAAASASSAPSVKRLKSQPSVAGPLTHSTPGTGSNQPPKGTASLGLDSEASLQAGAKGDASATAAAAASAAAVTAEAATQEALPAAQAAAVARSGAAAVLRALCKRLGSGLWTQLPMLWDLIASPLTLVLQQQQQQQQQQLKGGAAQGPAAGASASPFGGAGAPDGAGVATAQASVHALQIMRLVGPHLEASLAPTLEPLLPALCACVRHAVHAVRAMASTAMAALSDAWLPQLMPPLLRNLVPLLQSSDAVARLGGVLGGSALVDALGPRLVQYAVLLVVPLLRCMSDPSPPVRLQASSCFGALVALLPLAHGAPTPPGLDDQQIKTVEQDTAFLMQLLDNKRAEDYQLPMPIAVQLRPYQQEGINWLAFLRRFGLHGVLADDMGLGKTLQASAIMAAALVEQAQGGQDAGRPSVCLVVCPSTLVQHWAHEVNKFIDKSALRPVSYGGTPHERSVQQARLDKTLGRDSRSPNMLVMSYEHLRADVEWVCTREWLYCVLDEGHTIKSHKSRTAQACKRVVACHRLILSGTPIQNNVLELWSLFDFLLPGFLGPEREFNARYGKALQAARYSKKGSREAEVGVLAVDALHKQVMPFILRRTKAQVLADLPPKIIQDVYCEMSPLQRVLYEDFKQSQASGEAASVLTTAAAANIEDTRGSMHVFQSLHYLRKLCSHPAFVLDVRLEEHRSAVAEVLGKGVVSNPKALAAALSNVAHAPKLLALRELLFQCGVIQGEGEDAGAGGHEEELAAGGGGGHRLLVFAQFKGMLERVEKDVLQPLGVSFLRIDGSIESSQRFAIVQRFNSDPTIDVLLLTTSVGGLGLNLTSADTVVFLEHDWNPMKDLQAMDRAHRLGQTRTVNVYRLLMAGTLEEKVMGLQQFKMDMANTVVNQDNISLSSMDTGRLLDLFGKQAPPAVEAGAAAGQQAIGAPGAQAAAPALKPTKTTGLEAMLAGMGELWDEKEYEQQFDMQSFMEKLGRGRK